MAVSLITVRVLLNTLGIKDYGTYNAIAGFISSLVFVSSALSAASQRFFSYYLGSGNKILLKESFSMIFFTYLIVVVAIIIIAESIGVWFVFNKMCLPAGRENAVMWVFQMALLTSCFSFLSNPFQALIISHEEMNIYAVLSIVEVVLKLLIILLLPIILIDKLILYSILHFMVFAGIASVYFIICYRKYEEAHIQLKWNIKMFKSIFSYTSWSMFGSISGMLNTQGINILLNIFYGPIANAAYAISAQVSAAVNQFSSSFYTAVRPSLIKSYASEDFKYMTTLFYMSNKVLFMLMFILIVPIFLVTRPLLSLWLSQVDLYMIEFVRLALIYTFILCLSNPITTIIQAANKVKLYHGLVDSFTLLSLPLIYLLFKINFHPIYAYVTTITIFILAHAIRLIILSKTIDFSIIQYLKKIILPIIFTIVIVTTLSYAVCLIPINNELCIIFIRGGIGFISATVVGFYCVFTIEERVMFLKLINKKFLNR